MRFKAKVLAHGQVALLELEAASEQQVREQLAGSGQQLLALRAVGGWQLSRGDFSLGLFAQELVALLDAGLSLTEAVDTLREKSRAGETQAVLGRIADSLYQGLPLSKALALQPAHFPPLFAASVAAAEQTGHLADAVRRYHHYEARLLAVRKKVLSALIYPAVIISIGALVLLFLLFYVIPRFSQIYQSMRELPAAAQLMLWWGELVQAQGGWLWLGLLGTGFGAVLLLRSAAMRAAALQLLWRLPRLAQLRQLFALTRFYRTLGLLLAGGLAVVPALGLTRQLLPQGLASALDLALVDIRAGQPLSQVLARHGLTTPVAERLLRVGEQSGELATMCERTAQFCDEELDRAIELFTRLFEPLLMLGIGILIGSIVFLLYMPIFELAESVQ
ncbi:type II secretion system F family protein [Chitinimonas taiwanensis]|uniref:General secretion pathway protein F n=1 Tax=Chitinimonas taiwanensis DSM 18899 TaxID=1121279 RepID=A0A1K2HRV5_9NEIS|nr:type II secretion system F family protein [Chitinimonas taiwanensis]SFZ79429.1 general secretion pathway protein F [Chitinimonas taiwanensis DSM 18899]